MNEMLQILQELIRRAGKAVQQYAQGAVAVQYKDDQSPVTDADMASHKIIVDGLADFGYPILSEEGIDDKSRFGSEWLWLIDPLDGTKDFLEKTGEFTIMIGLLHNGVPVLGLIYQPIQEMLYYAERGRGSFFQEKNQPPVTMHVSNRSSDVVMWVSRHHTRLLEKNLAARLNIQKVIPCGSIGLKASHIASGHGEIYINSGGQSGEWDTCAPDIIITEAGGKMTDMDGERIKYNKPTPKNQKGIVITNGILHGRILAELSKQI